MIKIGPFWKQATLKKSCFFFEFFENFSYIIYVNENKTSKSETGPPVR